MQDHFRRTARHKVSRFILGEEGRVGSKTAFTAATAVSVASLTSMLLGAAQKAYAGDCNGVQCNDYCCYFGPPADMYLCMDRYDPAAQYCDWVG
jgi:hypothetical protein